MAKGDPVYLEHLFDWLSDIATTYAALLALGGKAVPHLQSIVVNNEHPLRNIAYQLLQDISEETTRRLSYNLSGLCPACLVRCSAHQVRFRSNSVTYYGCRACGQSQEFIERYVVVLLDQTWSSEQSEQDGIIKVNWSAQKNLCDFDEIQILQASDEEVERFMIQLGNDPDPVRREWYKRISCTVSSNCELSENTMRILRAQLGQVKQTDVTNNQSS